MPHRRMLAPIQTEKHYVHHPNASVASGAISVVPVVVSVAVASKDASNEVEEGSIIKAVHVELWCSSTSTSAQGIQNLSIEKIMGGQVEMTFAQSVNLGAYPNKKNLLYTTQGLTPVLTASPLPLVRQWFAIPKGKQRFGLGDRLVIDISATGQASQFCGRFLYKEYK